MTDHLPSQPVEGEAATLLDALADGPDSDPEWALFVRALRRDAAGHDQDISQNRVRPQIAGKVPPQRIGAFYHRAARAGLITPSGWATSDDLHSRNRGKPIRRYRWTGGERVS